MSKIEWTDETWNPVTGCTKISPGCKNCYAEKMARRLQGMGQENYRNGFNLTLQPHMLDLPLKWKKPRHIFVNSMSDLFHKDVPFDFIDKVFAVMAMCPQHTFQVLTKRPDRMAEYMNVMELDTHRYGHVMDHMEEMGFLSRETAASIAPSDIPCFLPKDPPWPLPNVWLGTSVENQEYADKRIPHLLRTPAVVRFLSCEPLLGPLDLTQWLGTRRDGIRNDNYACPKCGYVGDGEHWTVPTGSGDYESICPRCHADEYQIEAKECGVIDWVIVGGESGPGARPMHPEWVRGLRDQCVDAKVPFFFKQWGEWAPHITTDGDSPECIRTKNGEDWWERKNVHVWSNRMVYPAGSESYAQIECSVRIGKKKAGRLLDGRTWDEMPDTCNIGR